VTAGAFATVWRLSAAHREALEGVTMLVASFVLFTVASWLVSKVEGEKWRAFVRARMHHALTGGGALALFGVSFLAVYREGFETVLFYGALIGTAEDALGRVGIAVGLGVGLALLAALYLGIQRWGIRIPARPFFAGTGILLTVLAVSFAGQGVAELQAAGWIPSTPIGPMPALPALGVFPTVQTVAAQLLVSAAFGVALLWIFWLSRLTAASALHRREP
jgi:high-affinity iron transporter